jgi:hypothetical protein
LKVHLHHFSKIKSQKEVTKQYESRFFLLFFDRRSGSGSISLNNGSGSRRPKSLQIRRIRIRNTAFNTQKLRGRSNSKAWQHSYDPGKMKKEKEENSKREAQD